MGRKRAIITATSEQVTLRLPDGMRDRLKEAADAEGRSTNTEIVMRLESSFLRPGPSSLEKKIEEIHVRLDRIEELILSRK